MTPSPAVRPACTRAELEEHLRRIAFGPSDDPDLVGLEVEVVPVHLATGRVPPVEPDGSGLPATGTLLGALAEAEGWRPVLSPSRVPALLLPGGGQLSFEPGGQLEHSTPPLRSVDAAVAGAEAVVRRVGDALRSAGVGLVARGVEPNGSVEDARLRLRAERYTRMSDHYDRRGPAGRTMMRQSAAIHVNVDLGPEPFARWRVLRRAVPSLVAAFANSPRAAGRETGHRSWRARQWRCLDPGRTGLPGAGSDPVPGYLEFALGADAFLLGDPGAPAEPFGRWLERGVDLDAAQAHLTTLFPEVRPRGYLEVRCFDALPVRWWAVPPVVCSGLVYDPDTLAEADATLPPADDHHLERAGRVGVRDPDVREGALRVLDLALAGAARLPRGMVGEGALERAGEFRDRLTARGRDPGDEPGDGPWGGPADAPPAG